MKKLLSVVLALAIVASSLIVFGAMATAAPAEAKAVKITLTKQCPSAKSQIIFKAPFLTATDFGDKDTLDLTFVLTNPLDQEVKMYFQAQEEGTWRDKLYDSNELDANKKPTGTKYGITEGVTVPANGVAEFKLTLPKTGYFFHTNEGILFASETYLEKLCIRVYFEGMTEIPEGTAIEMAIKDNDALNEKFVNSAVDTTWMNGTTTAEKLDANTMSAAFKNALTATPTPIPSATPVVDKAVVNGDAENGNTGWGNIHGGATTIVADPDNANNHVAKHVASGAYHSVAFDLGAAIVQDAANGYKGAGVGTYIITFKAKAEAGKGGSFNVLFNSKEHIGTGTAVGSYTTTDDTWVIGTSVEITDEWQEFTATVKVTEKYLNNIYEIFKAGKAKAYQLVFRLDGSKDAFKESRFTYYVDDITIAKEAEQTTAPAETATPTPAPTPNAIEVHAVQDTLYYLISNTGVMDADDIKNGVLKKEITIENVGENDFSVQLCIQATVQKSDGGATWAGFANEDGYVEIAAGEKETLTIEVEFEDGVTSILDQDVTVDKLFFRLNFNNNTTLNEGDGVLFYGDDDIVKGFASKTSSDKLTYATKVLNIKGSTSNTGDALPVALIATLAVATVALVVVAKKRKEN